MEIKSFRIKNYRSIKDSGPCYLSGDNITILAGKNESGKTAILEALEDFNSDKSVREDAVPINNEKAVPEIAVTFEIDKEELSEIFEEVDIEQKPKGPLDVEIIKESPKEYSLSEESQKKLGLTEEQLFKSMKKEVSGIYRQIKNVQAHFPVGASLPKADFEDITAFQNQLITYRKQTQPNLAKITDDEKRDEFVGALDEAIDRMNAMRNLGTVERSFIDELKKWIPNFILFISFEDIFPSEVLLAEADDNELVEDLAIISGLNLDLIKSGAMARKTKHRTLKNIKLKKHYRKFWKQDFTHLYFDFDSEKLYFFIKEGRDFYEPKLRSKGKQWHLAFYVKVSARAKEDVTNIILIDEPGLFLHAKAQKDVLKMLEDSAYDTPIIFSTHSPFLIDIDRLSRIRLISKPPKKGTLISNKIHKGAGEDTLTPIITAIGLDLSMGLDIAKDNNVILEGISDYYYLTAFKELLGFDFKKDVHFIPSVGADKFNILVPLMEGWGLNYCTVLDNDGKGRRTNNKLLRDFGHADIKTVFVSNNKEDELEDLFDKEDFAKHILNRDSSDLPDGKRNSQILKQKGQRYDKVLLSKLFYEKAKEGGISLSADTKKNFGNLLKEIDKVMFS